MQYVLYALPALACPIAMGLMMWFMMRGAGNMGNMGSGNRQMTGASGSGMDDCMTPPPDARLDAAREAPVAELRAGLAQLEARNRALLDELESRRAGETPSASAETPVAARQDEPVRR